MNAPDVKNPRSGFHDLLLIRDDVHVAPSSVETACHVSMLRLAGSRRRSNQITFSSPEGVESAQGKNWSFRAGRPFAAVLKKRASVQCRPPSYDCENPM